MTTRPNTLQPIPVAVLSGYLGAGKTTLINRLLATQTDRRLAVLVNDFGDINVDASLIRAHQGRTMSLTNGCICCSIAGDLTSALREVVALDRESPDAHIDRIIIEASGVADPAKIAMHAQGWPDLRLDGIVIVVDAEAIRKLALDRYVGTTVVRQVKAADVLVVSKADLTDGHVVCETLTWLHQRAPNVPIVINDHRHSAPELLLEIPNRDHPAHILSNDDDDAASDHFATVTWQPAHGVDQSRFVQALEHMSHAVPRCKGWVRFANPPDGVCLVQAAGNRIEIQPANNRRIDAASARPQPPVLSLIYLANVISEAQILSQLDDCIVPTSRHERHAST